MLRVGDIWRDGKLEAAPDYQLERLPHLKIDDTTVCLVKAGLNLDDRGFLVPLSEHPWHLQCTHSYCVMVELSDGRRILIPCIELIRFYFGSSSNLISKLFLPPLQRESLYTNARFDFASRRLVLDLAAKVSGASATDIGRMHLDPIAWRAALHVGTSALKAKIANQHIYPQAIFPFEGNTTLIACGKWLSLGDQQNSTFLVYSLRSCSHPFPFRALSYKLYDAHHGASVSEQSARHEAEGPKRRSAPDSPDQAIVERDASNSLAPRARPVRLEPRFPDLKKKAVWKENVPGSTESNCSVELRGGAGVECAAVGDAVSEQRIRGVDIAVALNDPSERRRPPSFLRDYVDELAKLDGFEVALLTESVEDGWTVPITALSNEDGEISPRLFVEGAEGMLCLRRASAFAVKNKKERVSIVVIESSPGYFKLYTTDGKRSDELNETLRCAAGDYLHSPWPDFPSISELIIWVFDAKVC